MTLLFRLCPYNVMIELIMLMIMMIIIIMMIMIIIMIMIMMIMISAVGLMLIRHLSLSIITTAIIISFGIILSAIRRH